MKFSPPLTLVCLIPSLAFAQSTISPSASHAWTSNSGWTNFRPSSGDGVVVSDFFLSGYAWDANTGWIYFGDGTPANNHTYGNNAASDHGVNHDGGGELSGYAYSANAGWINFGWASSADANRPRIDLTTGALNGYAWSPNLGWMRLGSGFLKNSSIALIDTDGDGISDNWERLHFDNLSTATATSDFDGDGQSDLNEFIALTLPKVPDSRLEVITASYSRGYLSVKMIFTSHPGRLYRVHFSDDLQNPAAWTESSLGLFAPDSGSTTNRTVSFPTNSQKFFRVTAVRPLSN